MHGICEIMDLVELVRRNVPRRSVQKGRYAIDDRRTGMLYRSGLYDVEFGIRFARDLPVAHIAVFGPIYFAYRLLFRNDPLIRFDRDDCRHTDTFPRFDFLSPSRAVNILIDDIGNVFLLNGFNRQAELIANRFSRVPRIGRNDFRRMRKLLFKFLFRQITAVCLGERQTVFIYIIAVRALDFFNLMAAASDKRDHIDPENILHAASRDRAVVFLGENVQLIGERGRRSPGINRLLAGRNDVYTARNALFNLFVNIPDKTE